MTRWHYQQKVKKLRNAGASVSIETRLRAAHERRMAEMSPEDRQVLQRAAELRLEREIRKAQHVAR